MTQRNPNSTREVPTRSPSGPPLLLAELTDDYIPSGGAETPIAPATPEVLGEPKSTKSKVEAAQKVEGLPSAAKSDMPSVPGYEVLEELGRGGMGVVYKARHLQLQRLVALKMILPGSDLSPERLERFLSEARAVARFQHPHLVQIHEIGEHEGQPFFSLELLEGGSLKQKLKNTPQLARESATLLEILALAVEYAHQKGIVHRDLKPGNVLLTAAGSPKVADFGLAKQLDQDSSTTEDGGIVGTPSYMAPEQAWGKSEAVGPGADIYALGVILYEMLTGRPPFQASDKWQTVELVRIQDPVPPRRLVPQVPRDLELICLKCLRKDQRQRFPSAQALAEELRRYLEGRPIQTRPTPFWEQAWKWTRRQPAVASLILVSVAALLSLLLFLDQRARGAQRELREQQRTSEMRDKVQQLHVQAQEAADQGNLEDAKGVLEAAFEIIRTEPLLEDLKPALAALQTEVAKKQSEVAKKNVVQQEKQQSDAEYRRFFKFRDTALFNGMVFTGVDLSVSVAATKESCRQALSVFGVSPSSIRSLEDNGPIYSKHLSKELRRQCTAACYELLLVWAEAVAQPEPGKQEPTGVQLEEALRLLDRASRLGLPSTGAFHQRRATYLNRPETADEARRERQLAAATRPETALDYFLTGMSHQRQGHLAEAADDFTNALREQPDHFWARYFLGVCNLRLQRSAQARDNFTTCLIARDDFLWLFLLRGFAHGQLKEFRAAEKDFQRALDLEKVQAQNDPQARYGILVNQGVLHLRQARLAEGTAVRPWPLPQAQNLDFAGWGAAEVVRAERLNAATRCLKEALPLQPNPYLAYRYLSLVAQQQQRLDDAAELLDLAIAAAKNREPLVQAQLLGQRARLFRERNNLDAARQDLDLAVQLFPTAEDHVERGRILHLLHRYDDAVKAYEAALPLRPTEAEVYRSKAEALLAAHREPEAAVALDQYVTAVGTPTADVYRLRGQIRARLRRFPAALADYTQALAIQPDSATYATRGWVFLASDAMPLALQDFEEALRLNTANAEAYAGRGLIRVRLGQIALALNDADAALHHGRPETPRLLWNIAHVYAQLVSHVDANPLAHNDRTGVTRALYKDLALEMLRKALGRLSETERAGFWRQYVAPDTLLNPLRGTPGFEELERKYGGEKGDKKIDP